MNLSRIGNGLVLDLAVWYSLPALFMLAYIPEFVDPVATPAAHFLVLSLPLAMLWSVRLLLATAIPNVAATRLISSLLLTSSISVVCAYYTLVLIGLRSWGGVVAWDVIPTFFPQATLLADALGVPWALLLAIAALFAVALLAGCWLYLGRFDWTRLVVGRVSRLTCAVLVVAGGGLASVGLYRFVDNPWTRLHEPVSLTLFPQASAQELEGHALDRVAAANLDRDDDAARAAYVPALPASRPNLILLVVDALRPDHLGIYGYPRDTTPNLARLAGESDMRVVRGARSSCGDTICGLLSMVSSKFPRKFSLHPFTLHEVLRRNGYRVRLILSGDHTHFYSLRNYYGPVDGFVDGIDAQRQGYFINDDQFVIDQIHALSDWDGKPVMFQLHLMAAHILRKPDDSANHFQPSARYLLNVRRSRDTGPGNSPDQAATNFYDNGVLKADAEVDSILKLLQAKGYLRQAMVVITADHGESLGEHGLFGHTNSVREELLRIPLVLISYGYSPSRRLAAHVLPLQVDIAPTILAELGIPAPRTWVGRALQDAGDPPFSYFEQKTYAGLIDQRDPGNVWKYWIDMSTGTAHAFNLSQDPSEDHDELGTVAAASMSEWRARTLSGTELTVARR